MKIVLPLPPNRANARWHWRTENKKKSDYYWRALVHGICRSPVKPYARARITATLYVWNKMDEDNLMARLKWPLDWLVLNRFITDDGPKVLKWTGLPEQVVDRKNQRIEIELEAIVESGAA